jgi:hypothetical protein
MGYEPARCDRCGKVVSTNFMMNSHEDGWNMVNCAPDAASGGTMVARHWRCDPARPSLPPPQADREAVREAVKAMNHFRKLLEGFEREYKTFGFVSDFLETLRDNIAFAATAIAKLGEE